MKGVTYSKGQFQWLNQVWSPTKLEDAIWTRFGFEDKEIYLRTRRHYMKSDEIAEELGLSPSTVRCAIFRGKI